MLIYRCVTAYLTYAINVYAFTERYTANVTDVVDRRYVLALGENERADVTLVILVLVGTYTDDLAANVTFVVPVFIIALVHNLAANVTLMIRITVGAFAYNIGAGITFVILVVVHTFADRLAANFTRMPTNCDTYAHYLLTEVALVVVVVIYTGGDPFVTHVALVIGILIGAVAHNL